MMLVNPIIDMDIERTMMKADTIAPRRGADFMPLNTECFSKRATKPNIVVTAVDMRQSNRQTP